jgi:HSP20 family molecular chaperone IbpA
VGLPITYPLVRGQRWIRGTWIFKNEEITQGSFERTFTPPEGVDSDKRTAEYRNGVLELTASVTAAALPRRMEVKTSPAFKRIAA